MELKKTKDIVEKILETDNTAREVDEWLFCRVYDYLGANHKKDTFGDIMRKIHSGEFPPLESIRRCRQRVQELRPELRGKNYMARNNKQEDYKALAKGD